MQSYLKEKHRKGKTGKQKLEKNRFLFLFMLFV